MLLCLPYRAEAQNGSAPFSPDARARALYDSLSNIESGTLLADSKRWVETDTLPEMAITALSVVVNRYYEHPDDKQNNKSEVVEALRILGNLYMVRVIDYKKAYRSLWMARQIAEDDKDYYNLAGVYNSLANLYNVNPGDKERKTQRVEEYLGLAAESAMRSKNTDMLRTITFGMSVWSFPRGSWGKLAPVVKEIQTRYGNDPALAGPLAVASACDSHFAGDNVATEKSLLRAKEKMDFRKFNERYRYSLDLILSDLYAETKEYDKALALMKADMDLAERSGHTDFLLNVYQQLTRIYKEIGTPDSTDYYYLKYNKLKNEFAERSSFGKVEEMDFMSQIDAINAEVENLSLSRRKEEKRNIIISAVLIVTLILLLTLLWIYINLKRNHRSLFERNREMLQREEEHRLLREQWEKERRNLGLAKKAAESESSELPDDKDDDSDSEVPEEEDKEALQEIYARILMVLDESPEIYSIGFTLNDLAGMIGQPVRSVSKAINLCHGDNFHQLLNKYRIREAARLMHLPENNVLTIQGIAERAGFKSRTSFASLFKKMMGLNPSEYWRMARRENGGPASE